jgi:hypothetical protein
VFCLNIAAFNLQVLGSFMKNRHYDEMIEVMIAKGWIDDEDRKRGWVFRFAILLSPALRHCLGYDSIRLGGLKNYFCLWID